MLEKNMFRYQLEQKILPNTFYKDKGHFLESVLDKGGKFFSDIFILFAPPESAIYNEKDFNVTAKKLDYLGDEEEKKELYIVIADMPLPEETPLCRRLYFCYEEETDTALYYMSELSEEDSYCISSVMDKGEKINYGNAPEDVELEFRRVGNKFLKKLIGESL